MENLAAINEALEVLALSLGADIDEESLDDLTHIVYQHLVRLT